MHRDGRRPGELFEVPLDELPVEKVDDFSFHQGPTSNLLRELRDHCGVEVVVVGCQPAEIPAEMRQGLSPPVRQAAGRGGPADLGAVPAGRRLTIRPAWIGPRRRL